MPAAKPTLYLISGFNGAGKTRFVLADEWTIFDNSEREPRLMADGTGGHARVMDEALYHRIQSGRT